MEVCWDGKCPMGFPNCCRECVANDVCPVYCESCRPKDEKEWRKYETCQGCEDRVIEPINCHTTCNGYKFRQKKQAMKNAQRRNDNQFIAFKRQSVGDTIKRVHRKKG